MNTGCIERHFNKIGARVKLHHDHRPWASGVTIDVGRDAGGEFFDVAAKLDVAPQLCILDTQPRLRHLLLMYRESDAKHKFLCGHDERHWFVAAVPERAPVSNVRTAMEALKPPLVLMRQNQVVRVKSKKRNRRRNAAFIRQGEWFFVPASPPDHAQPLLILRNEPLVRSGGKPHICEELVRDAGEQVYVSRAYPQGVTQAGYQKLIQGDPESRRLNWTVMRRNATVYVRGKIRHPDHKTVVLRDWHRVVMNTESQSAAMRHVVFLD